MDFGQSTRCISITWAIFITVCQATKSENQSSGQNFVLYMPTLSAVYCSHRVLFLTILGTLSLTLLGCVGCICCCCCRLSRRQAESLDAYAPRTQSIVWPPLPEETAHVVKISFLHTPGAVDCLCPRCYQATNMRCLEDCLNSSEC